MSTSRQMEAMATGRTSTIPITLSRAARQQGASTFQRNDFAKVWVSKQVSTIHSYSERRASKPAGLHVILYALGSLLYTYQYPARALSHVWAHRLKRQTLHTLLKAGKPVGN